jgi:hypothetical protein
MDHDATNKKLLMFRLAADKAGAESTTITEDYSSLLNYFRPHHIA